MTAAPARWRRTGTLARAMTLLGVAVAVVSLVVAGALGVLLIRRQTDATADANLARLADAAQQSADSGASASSGQSRALGALVTLDVAAVSVDRAGTVTPPATDAAALARRAVTPDDVRALLAGAAISARRTVDGEQVFVEGRATREGGVVLVQRRSDALRPAGDAIRALLVALAVALGIGVALSWLYARRLARPLQRTSSAALRLAAGHRDVDLPPAGPREVADVALAINTLTRSLAGSEARQREFLLSVSHDLRTPLTAITGYAESLADGVVGAADTARVGRVVLDESHRLARLVTDLLDLARLDAQTFRIDLADVDLADLVRRAADVWSHRCAAVGVAFRLDAPAGRPVLARTDPVRVRQVVDGLCENALRMTPAGRPMVLALRAEPLDGVPGAVVEVRDGGPGLSEQDLHDAFARGVLYERYRGARSVGTGLGLAIVHGLVQRLGGRVTAGHAVEGGARFSVWLAAAVVQTPLAVTPRG